MGLGQELLDAARTGNKTTVEKIVGQMMNKRSGPFSSIRRWPSVNVKDDDGYTPLHYASLNGHRDIVEKLLSADASPCVVDKKGATPLHLATFNGHTEIVYMLLSHTTQPVNIDQRTQKHETALLIAAQFGFNDIVMQLIAKGADVTSKDLNDMNALDLAAHFDRKEVLKHLLRVRPQLIDQYRAPVREGVIFKHTPLHRAAMNGRKQVVKELLAAGVDPNIRTESGTALHEAACYARDSVARVLLRRGADLKAQDVDGRTVLDLLADFPEESTRKVREVIREFMNKRCSYDSDEELPPFPVPGSPPAAMCIKASTSMSHDAISYDKIVTYDASSPISKEPQSPLDKSHINSDSEFIRTDSISAQQKIAKNIALYDDIQSGSKVLMIHQEVMSELKSLNGLQNKTPLVKTKPVMEKAVFENVVTKWPEFDLDREPHVSYGMAENEYYKAEKADKIDGIKGIATAKPEIHREKRQFHDATINEAKPIKTFTSQNDFVGINHLASSGENFKQNLRGEIKESEIKFIKQTKAETPHLNENLINSLKKINSHNDFNRLDKFPIKNQEPKVRRETMDSQFNKAKKTYDQNPFNSLKKTPRPKLTLLRNPTSETIDIKSIESNCEQYVRHVTMEKELKIKPNNDQTYSNNYPKTTSPNLDHDSRFRRGTMDKDYIKGQTTNEKTYNQNHKYDHVQHFRRGTMDKDYNKIKTVNEQTYNQNPKFDYDQRFRRGTIDKEIVKFKKSNDQTYNQNPKYDHDQRLRRGTMEKVKTANEQLFNQNSKFDHDQRLRRGTIEKVKITNEQPSDQNSKFNQLQRFRRGTMDKECVEVEATNEQKLRQNHELNHDQRCTHEQTDTEYSNVDISYVQSFNQKNRSPKFGHTQRFGREATKNKCEATSNPYIQTDSNTIKKRPRPLPKPKVMNKFNDIDFNQEKIRSVQTHQTDSEEIYEQLNQSVPHLIYEDVSSLNLPDDIKANMSIRQEVENQPLYIDMGSARKDFRQRLSSDCMPLRNHNMTGMQFADPSLYTDMKSLRQGFRKRFSSECKPTADDTNVTMSNIRNPSLYMVMRSVRRDLRKSYSSDYTNLPGALRANMFGMQEFENQPLYLEMRPARRSYRKRFISDYTPPPKMNRVTSFSYDDISFDELDSFNKKELSRVRSIPDCFMHVGAKTMHLRGDPGCLYEQYDYLYFDVINPRALREDVHPFIKTKHKNTPMPCYCQDLTALEDEIEQSMFYSCENLDDENNDDNAVYSTVEQIDFFNKHDEDSSSSQNDSINDSKDQTPPPLERKLTVILKKKIIQIKELVTEWTAPETQGISNKNESLIITPSSSVTKIHPQSFVKKLASKCLGLKAKFNSAPNINSTGTEAEVDVASKRSDHKIIGNSKFFKILSKKEESGEINCNDEFDTISLDRLGTLNRDSVVNRSNRSCPGFKTSLPNISENNELSDHESFTESVINTVVNCDMDVKNTDINEALNTNLNIFEPRERFSIISNVSSGSANLLNECYESYEFDETKSKNNTMPRPLPRPTVSNICNDNSIYENVTNIKPKPTPAARTHIPIKLPLDEVEKKVLYENITLLRDKKPEPPKRTLFPSQIRCDSLERNSTRSVSRSSTVSSDSMVDESNLEDILLSAKSKSFRHGQVASFYSESFKSDASRTKSNASDSSESSDMSAIENVDCSDDVEHNKHADNDKAIYLSMTGTLPNNKTESKESKKVLFRHKTFTNMEIDRNSIKVKDLPQWNNDFLKETLAHYHIRGTGHCIYNAPTVQEFMYIFNRDTLYKDVPPFMKVPNDKRDSYYETAICFCKPRPPKHHNSAEDLLEKVPQGEEKVSIDTEVLNNRREIFSTSFKCFCVSGTCKFHSNRRDTLGDLIVKFSAIKRSISTPDITLDKSPYSTATKSKLSKNMSIPYNLQEPYAVVNIEDIIGRKNENERTDERGYSIMSHPSTLSSNSSARPYSIKDIAEVISLNRSTSTVSAASNASDVCLPVRKSSSSEHSGHWSLQSCNSNVTIKSDLSFKSCLEASSEDSDGTLHSDDDSDAETIKSDVSTAKRPWVHSDSFRFGGNSKPEIETIAEENHSSFEDSKLETMSSKFESGISVEGSVSSSSGSEDDSGVPGGESCVSLGASLERGSVTGGVRSGSGRRRWDEEGTSEGDALSVSSAASSCAPLHLLHHHDYNKVSPTPPKKPPRRNLSVSPTHANSPSSGYSYELRAHARSQDDLDDIQGAKLYLKHGRSVDHYDSKLSYSEYEDNRIPIPPIPNPRPSLKQRQQPVAITAMYENVAIKQQNPRRKLRRNVESERMNDRVRKYSNQERSSLESLLDDQSVNSPSDCERYYEGPRVETPMSPSHYIQPPTPDHPPPSAKQAENSIHERIRPLSQEYKRRSALRDSYTETDGNLLRVASAASVASGATDRSGNTDNCVEEYVCDVPFAGLFKGSTTTLDGIGLRPMPAERPKTLRKLKSVYDSSPTEPQALNNGVERNFNGEEEVRRRSNTTSSNHSTDKSLSILSPFDEQEEWAKISEIMASFGSKLVRESVFVSELEQEFTSRLGLSCSESSLSPSVASNLGLWLAGIGLHDYESLFLEGGYDDIDFVNGVLDENDLRELGIEENDRQKIIESAKQLPLKIAEISNNHNNNNISNKHQNESVDEWLRQINLEQYSDTFRKHLYVDMDRVRRIWEVELTAVLEINKAGHRKRILASVSGEQNGPINSHMEDINADLNTLKNNIQQLKEEIKEKLPISENLKPVPPPVVPTLIPPGGETLKRSKKNRPAPQPPRPSDLEIRAPSELMVGQAGNMKPQWRHQPFVLVTGAITYVANYLGSTVVKELRGTESTKKSIQKLKKTKEPRDSPDIILSISYRGVKFLNTITRELVCEHEIRNIHCACQDADDLTHFAYITKDHTTRSHYCHVFRVATMDQATEVILTLGEAFEVAYQMVLREQSNRTRVTQTLTKTPTHDPTTHPVTSKEKPVNHGRSHSITEIKLNGHQLKIAPLPSSLSNEDFQAARGSDGSRSPRTPLLKAPIASTEEL